MAGSAYPAGTGDDPSDEERYPTLSADGCAMLTFLREHPHAPRFANRSGNRLTAADVAQVRAFEAEVAGASVAGSAGPVAPAWLEAHVARCFARVPFWRAQGARPPRFADVVPSSRADLARDIAAHVPDDVPVDRLINFRTTGTTGHPLLLPSHPVVAASYLAFHKRALARAGVTLSHGRGQVGVVLLGFQRACFTYVSVTPTMDESGLVKLNLHPDDWRDPADRAKYLEALAPEVVTGDPLSFAELCELPLAAAGGFRPRALLSTAMALLPGLRARLEERFAAPVFDLYSMNEAGPIAVFDAAAGGHVLLQHRLYVELLGADGAPVAPGERGEITLTGGFNHCLPLLRYRTGDFAALSLAGREPVLVGLEGRRPVRFRAADGTWKNNIDVTHALAGFALAQYTLAQAEDGALTLEVPAASLAHQADALRAALAGLFGSGASIAVAALAGEPGKRPQYRSDLPGAEP